MSQGNAVLKSGLQGFLEVPYNSTPKSWDLFANVSGSLSVDVRRSTYENWVTAAGVTTSIVGSEKPTLSSVSKNQDTNLTTWSGLSAGDVLVFWVDATPATVNSALLSITCQVV